MIDTSDTDSFAAEYVLGTLESSERAQALALMTIDPGFVEKIRLWERRLSELHLMVEPLEPDAKIWERIKLKIPQAEAAVAPAEPEAAPAAVAAAAEVAPAVEAAVPAADAPVIGAVEEPPQLAAEPEPEVAPPGPTSMPAAPQLQPALPPTAAPAESKPAPAAAPLIPERASAPQVPAATPAPRRRGAPFARTWATLMTLVVLAAGGLLAAWRFAPERVPPMLQPVEVLHRLGIAIPGGPPPRRPAPPESQYDE
jgi:hypothetical protein